MIIIRSINQLAQFAKDHGLRNDWHEPDEQNITARVEGADFDNAMGPGQWMASSTPGRATWEKPRAELHVIFSRTAEFESTKNGIVTFRTFPAEDLAVVNLASLCAWAARPPAEPSIGRPEYDRAIGEKMNQIAKLSADLRTVRNEASKNAKERDTARAALQLASGGGVPKRWNLLDQPLAIGVGVDTVALPGNLQLRLSSSREMPAGSFASTVSIAAVQFESGAYRVDVVWSLQREVDSVTHRDAVMLNPGDSPGVVWLARVADDHARSSSRKGKRRTGAVANLSIVRTPQVNLHADY